MRSSQVRDQTHVSCICRQLLYHWATKKALFSSFLLLLDQKWVLLIKGSSFSSFIGIKLLYNVVLVSAVQWSGQPYACMYLLPLWTSFPHPNHLDHHRALSWGPCAIQQLPTSSFTHGSIYMSMLIRPLAASILPCFLLFCASQWTHTLSWHNVLWLNSNLFHDVKLQKSFHISDFHSNIRALYSLLEIAECMPLWCFIHYHLISKWLT